MVDEGLGLVAVEMGEDRGEGLSEGCELMLLELEPVPVFSMSCRGE